MTRDGQPASGSTGMWGGRFASAADPLFRAVNDSLPVDWRLVEADILGSRAWAGALARAGVLTHDEAARLHTALDAVLEEARARSSPPTESGAEDVHSWVEQRLIAIVGPLGKKLHTGRSRNDQVATDLRLWLREALDARIAELRALQRALVALAQRHAADHVLPGYTHLQRAQPVLLGHWCLAYVDMLERDIGRFADARLRGNQCPLGCAALAGTAYPVDRHALAAELGFDAPAANSLDAVSDRDGVLEVLASASICAMHLSRLAEELILYATDEFGFIRLEDAMTSGSSLMPQKKNPDALELLRGKAGGFLGAFVALLATMKGLPLAYNKDMQEDKAPLFRAMDELSLCLLVGTRVLAGVTFDPNRCREAARGGHANATDLADYLVERGVPFRDAHEHVGRLVRLAIERGVTLEALPIEVMRSVCPEIGPDVAAHLSLEAGLARRNAYGGTSVERVSATLAEAHARLEAAGP
ncbi:MAG: argininosuccinate lyase [Phycisphaeraceae bacterium]|nr:argininosuccinate lyase [Phycisphaeraceae bacterium]